MSSPVLFSRGEHRKPRHYPSWLESLRPLAPYAMSVTGILVAAGLVAVIAVIGAATVGYASPASPSALSAPSINLTTADEAVTATAPQVVTMPAAMVSSRHVVASGDTLSSISGASYGRSACWPGIYRASEKVIGSDPDRIYPGQRLVIPTACDSRSVAASAAAGSPAVASDLADTRHVTQRTSHRATHHSAAKSAPAHHSSGSTSSGSSSYAVTSAFQACVIHAESGGNPQIWNASGHWGLYQFSYSTWVGHGGAPSLFGKAGGAYQTKVFWQTVRDDGTSDWAPYDGCA
jgi:LysM repeat protein